MNIKSRRIKAKIRSIKRPKLVITLVISVCLLLITSGVVYARYSTQKKVAKNPDNHQSAKKTDQNTNSKTTSNNNSPQSKNNTTEVIKPKTINLKCLQKLNKEALAQEQKRHLDKQKEIMEYWQKNGNANSDGYKTDITKEAELNKKNTLEIYKTNSQKSDKC